MTDLQSAIWRMQIQADIRGLVDVLRHELVDARQRAAVALRALGATGAIPALQMALVDETDAAARRTFIATLDDLFQLALEDGTDLPQQQHHPLVALIAQLSSPSHEQIIRAAQQLGDLNARIAAETLMRVFHRDDLPSRVRLAAAEALLKLESAPVEVSLLAALRHAEPRVRRSAAGVLGQLEAVWAVDALIAALDDPHEGVHRTAAAALRHIGTPEALAAVRAPRLPRIPLRLEFPPVAEEDTRPAPPLPDDVS